MYFPRVFMELTNFCNLSCVYCPTLLQKRPKQFLDFELFKKIIDDLFTNHSTGRIDFHMLGEPLLHKDFFRMIAYICAQKKYPVKLSVATNGIVLKKDSLQKELLRSGINMVGISIRSENEHEYKLKSIKNNLPDYADHIESIKSFIRKVHEEDSNLLISLGYFHTVESPFTLVFPYPFITKNSQIRDIAKFWHNVIAGYPQAVPIKKVKLPSLKARWSYENNVCLSKNLELRIESVGLWRNQLLSNEYFIKEALIGKCALYKYLNINSSGDVVACNQDNDGDINFGNLKDSTINEIITSEMYVNFKMNMDNDRLTFPICKKCSGTVCKKDNNEEIKLKPPRLIKYYHLFKDNPERFFKNVWEKIKKHALR